MQASIKTNKVFMKKNKQFIKLCHKYIHNINGNILQIYIILQYTYPLRRESFKTTDSAVIKTNAVVLQVHKEHSLALDSVTRCSYALIWMQKKQNKKKKELKKQKKKVWYSPCDSSQMQWKPNLSVLIAAQ